MLMIALCERRTPAWASSRQQLAERQSAGDRPADREKPATRQAVAKARGTIRAAENRQHGRDSLRLWSIHLPAGANDRKRAHVVGGTDDAPAGGFISRRSCVSCTS